MSASGSDRKWLYQLPLQLVESPSRQDTAVQTPHGLVLDPAVAEDMEQARRELAAMQVHAPNLFAAAVDAAEGLIGEVKDLKMRVGSFVQPADSYMEVDDEDSFPATQITSSQGRRRLRGKQAEK